jgi:preprotein translocase subunit SecA
MASSASAIWRTLSYDTRQEPLPKGIDAIWDRLDGLARRLIRRRQSCLVRADKVLRLEKEFTELTDARLHEVCEDLRDRFLRGRETAGDMIRAFAMIREVAFRQLGMRHYRVQLAGGFSLVDGCITEMATGEGKTLTATLAAVVAGWRGRGCHVMTVNDYLAERDAEDMSPVYKACGLSVAFIGGETPQPQRREGYLADVTYLTNKEVAADFLRDRLALGSMRSLSSALLAKRVHGRGSGTDKLVQRGLHYAIVDEADSVLIDEAVTPLIISGQASNPVQVEAFEQAAHWATRLDPGRHYRVNRKYHEVTLTSAGQEVLRRWGQAAGGIWTGSRRREELMIQAITARELYVRGQQYIVQDDAVVIVDEFTGRLMPDREWRDGLHQAVSAKEGLEIEPPKATYARISFQRFFRMYRQLSGMTGTGREAISEFWQIYHLPIVEIPTNRPCLRKHLPDRVFPTQRAKYQAIAEEIQTVHQTQRPILVGTRNVKDSEYLSNLLHEKGLEHEVLNAVYHKEEAQIVSRAGQPGAVTVATNMAGRGTDIKLGRGIKDIGGLHVVACERHESPRVDRQLYGRAGRQGDPGSCQAWVSLEDDLVQRHAAKQVRMMQQFHRGGEKSIASAVTRQLWDQAQSRATRMALRQRKSVLETDNWLDEYLGFAGME